MVDFESNRNLFESLGVTVVAASVDAREETDLLVEGLRLSFVVMLSELDGPAVAETTGASLQTGDRTFLNATGFLIRPTGEIVNSVYSSGPIGRFTANDVLKKVIFEQSRPA